MTVGQIPYSGGGGGGTVDQTARDGVAANSSALQLVASRTELQAAIAGVTAGVRPLETTGAIPRLHLALASRGYRTQVAFCGSSSTAGTGPSAGPFRFSTRIAAAFQGEYASGLGSETTQQNWSTGTIPTTAGIHSLNYGVGGSTSATFLTSAMLDRIAVQQPDVVFFQVANDPGVNTVAQFKTNILARIDEVKARVSTKPVTFVLLHIPPKKGGTLSLWLQYGAALGEIAASKPESVIYIDVATPASNVGYPTTDDLKIGASDGVHFSDAGHAFISDVVLRALLIPAPAGAPGTTLRTDPASDVTAPSVPGTPTATAGVTSASVAFAASTDDVAVTNYQVFSSADAYAAPVASGSSSPITVSSLPPNTAVSFKVRALDAAGNASAQSAASNQVTPTASSDTTAPTAPTLAVPTSTANSVTLTWAGDTDNVGVVSYQVFRGVTRLSPDPTTRTFTETGLTPATSYGPYTVKAVDAAGNVGPASNAQTINTAASGSVDTSPTALNTRFLFDADSEPDGATATWEPVAGTDTTPASQATSTLQPLITSGVLAGHKIAAMEATRYASTGSLGTGIAQPGTVFVLFRLTSLVANQTIMSGRSSGGYWKLIQTNGLLYLQVTAASPNLASPAGRPVVAGQWYAAAFSLAAGAAKLWFNSVTPVTGTVDTGGMTGLTLGASGNGGSNMQGDLQMLQLCTRALTQDEVAARMGEVAARAGITLAA